MKTITVNLYQFSELSEEAKEKVINHFRESNYDYQPYFIDGANDSFEAFAKLFSIDWRNIDYSEPYRNDYRIKISKNEEKLSFVRLATYIQNNYYSHLFKRKVYFHKSGKKRYSKIQKEHSCVLTGVCYDDDVLQPIYDFLDKPTNIDFETLLNDCIYSFCHSVSNEIDYRNSDEAIIEEIEANEYDFDENGNLQ